VIAQSAKALLKAVCGRIWLSPRRVRLLRFFHVNGDLDDLAGELMRRRGAIILGDRCLTIFADIGTFVDRGDCVWICCGIWHLL
jgi:hypothetical protein